MALKMGKHLCFTAMIVLMFANILAVQGEMHSKFVYRYLIGSGNFSFSLKRPLCYFLFIYLFIYLLGRKYNTKATPTASKRKKECQTNQKIKIKKSSYFSSPEPEDRRALVSVVVINVVVVVVVKHLLL